VVNYHLYRRRVGRRGALEGEGESTKFHTNKLGKCADIQGIEGLSFVQRRLPAVHACRLRKEGETSRRRRGRIRADRGFRRKKLNPEKLVLGGGGGES